MKNKTATTKFYRMVIVSIGLQVQVGKKSFRFIHCPMNSFDDDLLVVHLNFGLAWKEICNNICYLSTDYYV